MTISPISAYTLVIVWALVAISIRQINLPLIAVTGLVLAIALILLSLVIKRLNKFFLEHPYQRRTI